MARQAAFTFAASDMEYFRKFIFYELVTGIVTDYGKRRVLNAAAFATNVTDTEYPLSNYSNSTSFA